jgi:hypothetical protein
VLWLRTIKTTLAMNERQYDCDVCVTPVERKALAVVSTAVKPASMKQEATADSTRCSTRRSTPKDVLVRI